MDVESRRVSLPSEPITRGDIIEETKKQLRLAGPLVCVNILTRCLQVISLMFVGHLGELPLAGASMATSFAFVSGFSFLIGLGSGLETFCGQSYGAKQYHLVGIHMQRAMVVLLLVTLPIALMWAYMGELLILLGQNPEVSVAAGRYALFLIPSIFAYAIIQCANGFLQTQNIVVPMMGCAGLTAVVHLFVCWILVFKSGLGSKGAALATSISYWINAVSLVLYVTFSPSCKETWTGLSKEAFRGIPKFLSISIPSALMLILETWSFELMIILSGLLPNPVLETSVMSISFNTSSMFYMIPLGLSGVISVRVSNELGSGRSRMALLAIRVALCMVVVEATLAAAIMILGRHVWGHLYSREERVVKYVSTMLLLIAVSHFFDGIQSVLSGTIRGAGRQKIGAIVNLAAYYLVGVPCGIVLAFVYHKGGKGLWTGIIVAIFIQTLCLGIITMWTNWEKQVGKASQRVHGGAEVTTNAP